jgi:hypothetical protein
MSCKRKKSSKDKTMATFSAKNEKIEVEFIIAFQFQKIKHLNSKTQIPTPHFPPFPFTLE